MSFLIVADLAVVFLSFGLAYYFRSDLFPRIFSRFGEVALSPYYLFFEYSFASIVWILAFAIEKLYTRRYPFWEEIRRILKSTSVASAIVMIMIFIAKIQTVSRTVIVLAWLLSLILFPLIRTFVKLILVKNKLWTKKLLILGVSQTSLSIVRYLRRYRSMGYQVIGYLDEDKNKQGKKFLGIPVLGTFSQLEQIARANKTQALIVVTPHMARKKLKEYLKNCEDFADSMWIIPRSGDFIIAGVDIEVFGDVLTLRIKKNLTKHSNLIIKTIFEVLISTLLLIFLLPLMIVLAAAIALDSGAPVFFVQERAGKLSKVFQLYKFRSMFLEGDHRLHEYLKSNSTANEEWKRFKKIKGNDPRVTRVGRFIRRFSLDELPQLFNVLRRDMNLVGPRPYIANELDDRESAKSTILKVRPGITGLWQISGRSELSFEERLSLDEYYIRNWSLWLDIVILLKSFRVLISGTGAY